MNRQLCEKTAPIDGSVIIKVLLVGPFPPPYGGIATRVDRLRRFLNHHQAFEVAALNLGDDRKKGGEGVMPVASSWDFLRKVIHFARSGHLVHLETNGHNTKSWISAFVCVLAGLLNGGRTFVAFGSGAMPRYIEEATGWRRLAVSTTVKRAGRLFCRNVEMRDALVQAGADPGRIITVPGFMGIDASSLGKVPAHVKSFLGRRSPSIGIAAYSLDPEYAIPFMLESARELLSLYPRAGLLILGIGDEARSSLPALPSEDAICLVGALPHPEALATMQKLDVFVRPTLFDGDSNTVREALALGVPVVASDTGFRPAGVLKFRLGDSTDLVARVQEAIENGSPMEDEADSDEPDPLSVVIGQYFQMSGSTRSHLDRQLANYPKPQDYP